MALRIAVPISIYMKFPLIRAIFLFILIGILSTGMPAQTYTYSIKENKYEFISSIIVFGGIHLYDQLRPSEMIHEPDDINADNLWGFDRGAIDQDSEVAGNWSNYTLYASMATPILFSLGNKSPGNEDLSIAFMGLQGFFIENGLTHFVKMMVKRPRPFVYRDAEKFINVPIGKNYTKSFYSGHTSSSAYFSFFAAKVFSDTHPDSQLKPYVWGIAATLPVMTGYFRYKAGKHFPTDIITGYVVGASLGYFLPELYQNKNLSLTSSADGLSFSLRF